VLAEHAVAAVQLGLGLQVNAEADLLGIGVAVEVDNFVFEVYEDVPVVVVDKES